MGAVILDLEDLISAGADPEMRPETVLEASFFSASVSVNLVERLGSWALGGGVGRVFFARSLARRDWS